MGILNKLSWSKKPKEDGHLSRLGAIRDALLDRSIEFYPRLTRGAQPTSLTSDDILEETGIAAGNWPHSLDDDQLKTTADRARESLDEVKALTEYQDQKATRLLTVTTFLSALGGVLLGRFADSYPLRPLLHDPDLRTIPVALAYLAFASFALSAVSGAIVTFHAIRTRFKYPQVQTPEKQEDDPKSLLFYDPIIRVSPTAWAGAFVREQGSPNEGIRKDLMRRYLANYIAEAYLIAAKAADKLRYLQPAQLLLSFANKSLLAFLLFAGVSSLTKPSKAPPPAQPAVPPPALLQLTLQPPPPAENEQASATEPAPAPEANAASGERR